MFQSLLNIVFGCTHRRTTFPQTPARRPNAFNAVPTRTYVVCLDCGKEFGYDWKEMQIGDPVNARVAAAPAESYSLNR